jgi:hypothetical protein
MGHERGRRFFGRRPVLAGAGAGRAGPAAPPSVSRARDTANSTVNARAHKRDARRARDDRVAPASKSRGSPTVSLHFSDSKSAKAPLHRSCGSEGKRKRVSRRRSEGPDESLSEGLSPTGKPSAPKALPRAGKRSSRAMGYCFVIYRRCDIFRKSESDFAFRSRLGSKNLEELFFSFFFLASP